MHDIRAPGAELQHDIEPPAGADVAIVLSVEQAAAALGIGRSFMYALVGTGAVESIKIGRLRRIPTESLHTFVRSLRADNHNGAV